MWKEVLIAAWSIAGVSALVGRALFGLTPIALEAVRFETLSGWQWCVLLGWVAVNAYAEGYRGFHRSFSPRVVERAFHLGRNPTVLRVVLGAPYAIGWFAAPRRVVVTAWAVTVGIVMLVVSVRHLAQPWRGIVDAGVVVGLGFGLVSLLTLFFRRVHARSRASRIPTG